MELGTLWTVQVGANQREGGGWRPGVPGFHPPPSAGRICCGQILLFCPLSTQYVMVGCQKAFCKVVGSLELSILPGLVPAELCLDPAGHY